MEDFPEATRDLTEMEREMYRQMKRDNLTVTPDGRIVSKSVSIYNRKVKRKRASRGDRKKFFFIKKS
jgi:hypothetical protein